MSEPLVKHQIFEYRAEEPFHIYNIYAGGYDGELLMNHWHEELELAYVTEGISHHYIDGECVCGEPGRLVVTNSESVHNIIPDNQMLCSRHIVTVVLMLHARFLDENFPGWRSIHFMNEKKQARNEIKGIMMALSEYARKDAGEPYEFLYAKGLILQLLYYMCEEGIKDRSTVFNVNYQKNIERLKGVLQYVEQHYTEQICQAEVAQKFYFSKEYFSRYFKKCIGMTFTDYVTRYRLTHAREELLTTEKSILDIALHNGFSDDRRFISAFKKQYTTTPFQYRKKVKNSTNQL